MFNSKLWRGLTAVLAFLLVLAIMTTDLCTSYTGQVSAFLGVDEMTEIIDPNAGTDAVWHYKSEFGDGTITKENQKLLEAAQKEQCYNEMAEGATLMKNNGALPFDDSVKNITIFGNNATNMVYLPSGGGDGNMLKADNMANFKESIANAGFNINPVLWKAYEDCGVKRVYGNAEIEKDNVGEAPFSVYTDEVKASFDQYNDAAIIVISREQGEGSDARMFDYEGISLLAIHKAEKEMIDLVKSCGKFDKIIVLINSTQQIELDWTEDDAIDAVLWVGTLGQWGALAIPDILKGEVNPSGRLPDTWAANSLSSPACVNSGTNAPMYENIEEIKKGVEDPEKYYTYMSVQVEGIYFGYKYYETRYEDAILNQGGAKDPIGAIKGSTEWNYAKEMNYTFGHGLSYTTFDDKIDSVVDNGDNTMTVKITVTNTGDVAGKHSVPLYAQTPYGAYEKENLVEKSAITIVQFEKTKELQPGESQTLELVVEKYLLASYDENKAKTYIMSEGDYYFAIGVNAHEALNNILAAKGATGMYDELGNPVAGDASKTYKWHEDFDSETFSKSLITGADITNRFDDCDINFFFDKPVVTYITRQNWAGTYPTKQTSVAATPEMIRLLNGYLYEKPADAKSVSDFVVGDYKGIKLLDLKDVSFDDALWEEYLNQYTLNELAAFIAESSGTIPMAKFGINRAKMFDGPMGVVQELPFDRAKATTYPGQPILAATMNKDVLRRRGEMMGEVCLFTRVMSVNAPGCNLHRTPFNGRSAIYYSEDGYLTYLLAKHQVLGFRSKGASGGAKHFVLNDQEFYRHGLSVFFTEQSAREGALRAFESVLTGENSYACMMSFNRVGCVSQNNSEGAKTIARDEWDFRGFLQTDAGMSYSCDYITALASGTTLFTGSSEKSTKVIAEYISANDDGNLLQILRDAVKFAQYANLNSNVINGMSKDAQIIELTPWWLTGEIALCIGFGVLTLGCMAMYVLTDLGILKGKKKED